MNQSDLLTIQLIEKNFKGNASIVIFPKSVEKLVNVIKKCNEKKYQLFLKVETQV